MHSLPFGNTPEIFQGLFVKLPSLGVAFTGLVMGLGSDPTHEAIRALQEVKKKPQG
jgi:hypothetical protein